MRIAKLMSTATQSSSIVATPLLQHRSSVQHRFIDPRQALRPVHCLYPTLVERFSATGFLITDHVPVDIPIQPSRPAGCKSKIKTSALV
jgi:hypothetical protein